MKIVADPNIPFVREAFGALGEVTLVPGRAIAPAAAREAEVLLVRSVTPVNAALLAGSRVQFVATATIGFDHIDRQYLATRDIGFASAAGSNANSVAEYVVAALLELAHRGKYRLRDKTLGVVGVGHVGSKVVRYAEALGLRVLPTDPPLERLLAGRGVPTAPAESDPPVGRGVPTAPSGDRPPARFVSLDRVLAEADIVTLHVPLTKVGQASRLSVPEPGQAGRLSDSDEDATYHLFDRDNLERFTLINTARGAVVDNPALLEAIDGDRLPAVVLDVWEHEPKISPELLDVVDLGTPHIAGYSFDGKVNGTRLIYEALCRFLEVPATWQPKLPPPPVPLVDVFVGPPDDDEEVLRHIVRQLYEITADDAALRKNVLGFDELRAGYPVRREFGNTRVKLRGSPSRRLLVKLAALGFQAV